MVLYCTRVHQLDVQVYCHSTVLLLFWILTYLRVKENVNSRAGGGFFMTGGDSQVSQTTHKQQTSDIYSRSRIYKLTWPDCGKLYVGQTSRSFTTRFREHKIAFRTASCSSNFAKHLIDHTHTLLWPHPQHNANITTTKQRSTPEHSRMLPHLYRIHQQ